MYVEKIVGHRPVPSPSQVAGRLPASCTAVGKVLLAFSDEEVLRAVVQKGLPRTTRYSITVPAVLAEELEHVRSTGVAYDREEVRLGLQCVAAPVRAADGRLAAALSISCSTGALALDRLAPAVRTAANGVSRALRTG
jgi:DNA-binding IclR family transcriptional regulator